MSLRNYARMAVIAVLLLGCQQSGRPTSRSIAASPAAYGEIVGGKYIVAPGDTLAVVAKRTNTPIRTLIDLNKLQPPFRLRGGQELSVQPRGDYVVAPGDTVSLIALSQGVSPSALIQLNNLNAPYNLTPGQTLVLPSESDVPSEPAPSTTAIEPVQANGALAPLPKQSEPASGAPTLLSQPSPSTPKAIEPAPSQIDATPPLSDEPAPAGAGISESDVAPLQPAGEAAAQSEAASADPPVAIESDPGPAIQSAPPAPLPEAPEIASLPESQSKSGFIWPVDGKIVSKFGATADGLRNDGINISAPEGAPVKAAADGVVAYAGNELRGFGNMLLIKHAENWVTAYAHNSSLLVKKGEQVRQGQVIARVGSTGNVANPQLHFEIRNGTKAIDPMSKLNR